MIFEVYIVKFFTPDGVKFNYVTKSLLAYYSNIKHEIVKTYKCDTTKSEDIKTLQNEIDLLNLNEEFENG